MPQIGWRSVAVARPVVSMRESFLMHSYDDETPPLAVNLGSKGDRLARAGIAGLRLKLAGVRAASKRPLMLMNNHLANA
jgi:hypothetical protein